MTPAAQHRLALASFPAAAAIALSGIALLVGPPASPRPLFYLLIGLVLASAALLATAGAACRRRRPGARRLGQAYAVVGPAGALLQLGVVTAAFGTATVIDLVFPAVIAVVLLRKRRRANRDTP